MSDYQYTVGALNELRNDALLLTIGNEHLKDDVFLIKIGNSISHAAEVLKKDIATLKKEFPGKFMGEVDTDRILEKINGAAQRLINPVKETRDEHASGQLGREVEASVASIAKAVEDIKMKIHGTPSDSAASRSAADAFNKVKNFFLSAESLLKWAIKILACVVVLLAAVFGYFYFTMEKEAKYLVEISSTEAQLKEKKQVALKLQKEKQDLEETRKAPDRELTKEEKVAAMDVEVKIKKLDSKLEQTDAEISVYEQKLKENQDKLDALRKKPFMKRLLKQ
jgi:hypothetical protein